MDNASKNATDMIGTLQMQYNRGRQAAITNELVDIITGMVSIFILLFWRLIRQYRCQCSLIACIAKYHVDVVPLPVHCIQWNMFIPH